MTRSAASLHSLPSFVGISAFACSHRKVQNDLVTPDVHSEERPGTEKERENHAKSVPFQAGNRTLLTRSHLGQT